MAFRKNDVMFVGLHILLLTWPSWAKVEVSMEDRVEVNVGDTAEIPCMYSLSEDATSLLIQWFVRAPNANGIRNRIYYYGDNSMEIVDQGTGFTDRIRVSRSGGNVLLTVSGVKLSDQLEFICQVNGMSAGTEEGHTLLKVFESPEYPVIEGVRTGISVTNEHPSKIATCDTRNGFPKPNITWYRDQFTLQTTDGEVSVVNLVTKESSGLFSVQSELHLKVTQQDKDALFYCEVNYFVPGAVKMIESDRINITVHYPTTSVELWRESPEGDVKEGDTVEIRCRGNGNPQPPFTFKHKGHASAEGTDVHADLDVVVLKSVTRADSGRYLCSSLDLDTFEETEGAMDLVVNYLDAAVVIPEDSVVLEQGGHLTATCNALSSLNTHTVWLKDGVEVAVGHTLALENATFDAAGTYFCEVTAPTLPGLQTRGSLDVTVQGRPEITESADLAAVDPAERSVNLSCRARGHPKPTITWSFSDPLSLKGVSEEEIGSDVLSVATVEAASDTTASCNATNTFGSASVSFSVEAISLATTAAPTTKATVTVTVTPPKRVQKEGSGVIIAVLIICILLLAVLGSVLYFLYKKGKIPCGRSGKQDLTKEKASKDDIVVEMKTDKSEEAVLLQGVNGDKKPPHDQ